MTLLTTHRSFQLTRSLAALGLAASATLATACAADATGADDADQIASALEQPNGGLDTEDEAPMFGSPDEFAGADLDTENDYDDSTMEQSAAVTTAMSAPAAVVYNTTILWGNLPHDQDQVVHNWSGTLSVNRGAILIRRLIRFEDATDAVDQRTDAQTITFTSITKPAVDGFRLTIVDPDPAAADPLMLTYNPVDGGVFSVPMSALVSGPESQDVDGGANRIVALAMLEPADPCNHGFMAGRWHKVDDGHGRFIGRVADAEGQLVGHMRGVYGQRRTGERVFFGKYIDRDGHFKGLFAGTYADGAFRGRWLLRGDADHGVLAGQYRETIPGPRTGGHFLGRWAETSCNLRLDH